jgi:hypothetical protein
LPGTTVSPTLPAERLEDVEEGRHLDVPAAVGDVSGDHDVVDGGLRHRVAEGPRHRLVRRPLPEVQVREMRQGVHGHALRSDIEATAGPWRAGNFSESR